RSEPIATVPQRRRPSQISDSAFASAATKTTRNLLMAIAGLVRLVAACGAAALAAGVHAAPTVEGQVIDVNGRPVAGAQVVFDRDDAAPGASVVTVFTGDDGRFAFPGSYPEATPESVSLVVRALDHE